MRENRRSLIPVICIGLIILTNLALSADSDKGRITIPGTDGLKIPYYRNYPLGTQNNDIEHAIIVIQGNQRQPENYYKNMFHAAQTAGASSNTIIIAPNFMIPEDNPKDDEIYWDYSNGWKQGDKSTRDRSIRISSFEVMDQIIYKLDEPGKFPNLKSIVIIGHSAGGQFVQRFACGSRAENLIDIPIRYIVANPSSYLYLDEARVLDGTDDEFSIPSKSCKGYNKYKYGLQEMNSYMQAVGAYQIREQYGDRDVVYLLGNRDDNPNSDDLDTSCPAALQGNNRLERGLIYFNYLKYYYGLPRHTCSVVNGAGHDSYAMFNSPECIDAVFGWRYSSDAGRWL
jgi:hypothetical protein